MTDAASAPPWIDMQIFIDESADESGKKVFALGALIGTEAEWRVAVDEWVALTGGREVHANEFETEFVKDQDLGKHPARLAEYAALIQVIANSHLAGFSVAMDVAAYLEEIEFVSTDSAYLKCLTDLLGHFVDMTRQWNTAHPDEQLRPQLVMDQRQRQGTIDTLYETYLAQPEWRTEQVLQDRLVFDSRQNPRIQMSDVFAREAMKELERLVTGRRAQPRRSLAALNATGKFKVIQYPREYWRDWAAKVEALRQQEGFEVSAYRLWLEDTGRIQDGIPADNHKNRFSYLAWLDRQPSSGERSR